jgi:hypothetical protein
MDKMNYSTKKKREREKNKPKQIEMGCLHLTIIFVSVAKTTFHFGISIKKKTFYFLKIFF